MFRRIKADKDAYITNKYVKGDRVVSGNVGYAGTLDLFKIYGMTVLTSGNQKTPQTELSRILIHFDLDPLKVMVENGSIDIDDESFKCHLSLKDVYGGQPTPINFSVSVFPLSSSFDEGIGKDVAYYADFDRCNFLSSSNNLAWKKEGCSAPCFSTGSGDYITSSLLLSSTLASQFFKTGEEDLYIDVTSIISATLAGDIPDSGLRISFEESLENDSHTYFVKRFGSRHSYNEEKRPHLFVRFNDAIEDDGYKLYFDNDSNVFFYNYPYGALKNVVSSSAELIGDNCLLLKVIAKNVSGSYSLSYYGSQFSFGKNYVNGTYFSNINISSSDEVIRQALNVSGSVKFDFLWTSLDESVEFFKKENVIVQGPSATSVSPNSLSRYTINVRSINKEYSDKEEVLMRVEFFDENSPYMIAKKLPVKIESSIIKNCHYGIRDVTTGEYAIPFDSTFRSTLLSSDSDGMYFKFDTTSLFDSHEYVIDLMVLSNGIETKHLNASQTFRIKKM